MYILPHIQYNKNINNLIFLINNNNNNNNNNNIINISYNKYLKNILLYVNINSFNLYRVKTSDYFNNNDNNIDMYYQMVEIIKINNIIINNNYSKNINIFHINNLNANAGYEDCINNYTNANSNANYIGNDNVINNIHNYYFENNNMYFNNRLDIVIENLRSNKSLLNLNNLVISNYFNPFNKNIKYNNILLYQLCISLTVQKYNGTLIFKIYNSYDLLVCELIYLLSMLYKEVSLFKPTSCCYINGEIFIICKFFKLHNADNIVNVICEMFNNNKNILKILKFKIPYLFIKKIEEYNAIFGQNKIEIINQCLIEKNINKQEQLRINYLKKISSFCKILNIEYRI